MHCIPETNKDTKNIIPQVRVFALDMDGTIYLGSNWIDGARDFLRKIEESGRSYYFLTNNSSKSPAVYVEKLRKMGLSVSEDKIITSGQATIWYLKEHFPGKSVYLLGNDLLKAEFIEEGIELNEDNPDVAVVGFDTQLNYEKLCKICDFVRAGLPYIATHPDYNCPTEDGFIPDAGAFEALIHASSFRMPDRIIGKPNRDISDYLMTRIHKDAALSTVKNCEVAMVGDRLYTDIAAGINGGLRSILVLSGEASLEDAKASEFTPDLIFDSVKQITL